MRRMIMFSAPIKDVVDETEDSRFANVSFFLQAMVCGNKILLEIQGLKRDGEVVVEGGLSDFYRIFPTVLQVSFPTDLRSIEQIIEQIADAHYAEVIASRGQLVIGSDMIRFEVEGEYSSCLCTEDEAEDEVFADDMYWMAQDVNFCLATEEKFID